MRLLTLSLIALLVTTHGQTRADVRLAKIFTNNMVLQQELPINVWGWADAGENVTLRFAGLTTTAKPDAAGRWQVVLPSMKADGKVHSLIVQGKNTITLDNILLGEAWLCSGQSNMGRPVGGKALGEADFPKIRLFHVDGNTPRKDDLDEVVGWLVCSPETLKVSGDGNSRKRRPFSEVAYRFGLHLHQQLKVPVGIIQSNTGGSTAKDWTPLENATVVFPADVPLKRITHTPGACYQIKLRGLIPLTLRGAIWYQGEDDGRNRKYTEDLTRMITAWRTLWNRDDLPFYMAQIAQTTYASGMLGVWESQVEVANQMPHVALASSNTLEDHRMRADEGHPSRNIAGTLWPIVSGSNPHPRNKHLVAIRLADIALAKTYKTIDREVLAPAIDSHHITGNKIVVKFKHAGTGLTSDDGKPLNWFEISDGSKRDERRNALLVYVKAQAKIIGPGTIEVSSASIKNPKFVRFAWHTLARHNLANKEGIPAVSFRSDELPQMWNRR